MKIRGRYVYICFSYSCIDQTSSTEGRSQERSPTATAMTAWDTSRDDEAYLNAMRTARVVHASHEAADQEMHALVSP